MAAGVGFDCGAAGHHGVGRGEHAEAPEEDANYEQGEVIDIVDARGRKRKAMLLDEPKKDKPARHKSYWKIRDQYE